MVTVTGISIASAASAQIAGKTNREDVEQVEKGGAMPVDLSKVAGGAKAAQADSGSDSSEPPHIKQLRELMQRVFNNSLEYYGELKKNNPYNLSPENDDED